MQEELRSLSHCETGLTKENKSQISAQAVDAFNQKVKEVTRKWKKKVDELTREYDQATDHSKNTEKQIEYNIKYGMGLFPLWLNWLSRTFGY